MPSWALVSTVIGTADLTLLLVLVVGWRRRRRELELLNAWRARMEATEGGESRRGAGGGSERLE